MCADFDYTQRHSSFILHFFYYFFPTPNYLKQKPQTISTFKPPFSLVHTSTFPWPSQLVTSSKTAFRPFASPCWRNHYDPFSSKSNCKATLLSCTGSFHKPNHDRAFFFLLTQSLPCTLLRHSSAESALAQQRKAPSTQACKHNPFQLESFECENTIPGLTGTVYSLVLLTRQSQCCNFSLFLNSALKWEHFRTFYRQTMLGATR